MIDPYIWANTPGMGRAPLLPDPAPVSAAVAEPRRDIVRLLQQATGNERVMPGDRPVGQLVRPTSAMTIDEMVTESRGLAGPQRFAPNVAASAASMGTLGLGALGGLAGREGIDMRQRQLAPEIENRLSGILATGQPTPVSMRPSRETRPASIARTPPTQQLAFADAYEAGRQAAQGYRSDGGDQARDRSDISRSSRGSRTASFTRGDISPF